MCAASPNERESLRRCPVCVGRGMRKLKPVRGLIVDYCHGCGGLWCDRGEAEALRKANTPVGGWSSNTSARQAPVCRGCGSRVGRDDEACANCGRRIRVMCPTCERPMKIVTRDAVHRPVVRLDVCSTCEGVWFDATEFAATRPQVAARPLGRTPRSAPGGQVLVEIAVEFLLEAIFELLSDW